MSLANYLKYIKPTRTEHWITISISLFLVSKLVEVYLPSTFGRLLLYPGCILYIGIIVKQWKGNPLVGMSRILFSIMMVWTFILTVRMFLFQDFTPFLTGTTHGVISVVSFLFAQQHFFPHLLPLCICCFPRNYDFDIAYFVRFSCCLSLVFLLCSPMAISTMNSANIKLIGITEDMDILGILRSLAPAAIFIYLKKYSQKEEWFLLISIYVFSLVLAAYMGRRGGTASALFYIFMFWYVYSTKGNSMNKLKTFLIGLIVFLIAVVVFEHMKDSTFSYIIERGMEDNRSDRNEDLIADLSNGNDWLLGRGWLGVYYDSVYGYRPYIETGFLQLILRGGLLLCIPYVLLLLFSFINGFFRSKNYLCKSLGAVALVQLFCLYPNGVPAFSMSFFLMWIGVLICNNPTLRRYDDMQIQEYFFYGRV